MMIARDHHALWDDAAKANKKEGETGHLSQVTDIG